MLVLRKRGDWIKRENSQAAKNLAKYTLTAFDHYLLYKKTGEVKPVNFKQYHEKLPNLEAEEHEFLKLLENLPEEQQLIELDALVSFWLDERQLSPKSTRDYFGYFRNWLRYNGIKTDDKECRKSIKFPKRVREMRFTPDDSMVEDLINKASKHVYGVFMMLLFVTGARQSELLKLKVKNIEIGKIDRNTGVVPVNLPGLITKQSKERYTFLTPEAVETLQLHIKNEKLRWDDEVFSFTQNSLQTMFANLRKKIGFTDVYESSTQYAKVVHKLTLHRFRAACNKRLTRAIGDKTTQVIIGHGDEMTTYDEGEITEMCKDYAKAVPNLTVSKTRRLKIQEEQNQTLEIRQNRMQDQMDAQKREIEALKDLLYRKSLE